jgi:hypothetical protein
MEFYKNITQAHPLRYGHQFTVEFLGESLNGLTGGFTASQATDVVGNITYYVQSSKIPAVDISSAKVSYFAAGFEIPGVVKYPDSWDVEILLDQDLTQYKRLQSWMEAMSSFEMSQGGTKTIPNVMAHVNLLDSTMQNVVKTYVMEGVWIQKLGNVEFKYEEGAASIAKCACTFTMQYWYDLDEGDPLGA